MSKKNWFVSSKCFGYNPSRFLWIAIVITVTVSLTINKSWWSIPFGVLLLGMILFNIQVHLGKEILLVKVLWIPVKSFKIQDIHHAYISKNSPFLERNTFGIHSIVDSWSIHAGAADLEIQMTDKRLFRLTTGKPEEFLDELHLNE